MRSRSALASLSTMIKRVNSSASCAAVPWLFFFAAATVSCSHSAPSAARPSHRWDESCLIKHSCPRAAQAAQCSPNLMPLALAELMRRSEKLDGTQITVRGPLKRGIGGNCTALGCYMADEVQTRPSGLAYKYHASEPGKAAGMVAVVDESFEGDLILFREGGCCNRCAEGLSLGDTLWLVGSHLGCSGDESLMCCTVEAHGQDI